MINTNIILDYLSELENNNTREWYLTHREERKSAEFEFEKLIQELIFEIGKFDESILFNEPRKLTFKLVKDTRFSKDKTPYNPSFRAHISAKGKSPIPVGYFIYIKPNGESFLGGGLFADMFSNATTMIRDYISQNPSELYAIINKKPFKDNFNLLGTKLKNVPRGYDKENPMSEYLKYKSWFLEYHVGDNEIMKPNDFIEMAGNIFHLMVPFNTYLNHALEGFVMPARG